MYGNKNVFKIIFNYFLKETTHAIFYKLYIYIIKKHLILSVYNYIIQPSN